MEKNTSPKTIRCERCNGVIEYRSDVVITTSFLNVVSYHDRCFSQEVKGMKTIFVNNTPINGTASNFGTVVIGIFFLIFLFSSETRLASLILLIPILVRAYAWFNIERHLK